MQIGKSSHTRGLLTAAGYDLWAMNCALPDRILNAQTPDYCEIGASFLDIGQSILHAEGKMTGSLPKRQLLEAAFSTGSLPAGTGDALGFALLHHFEAMLDTLAGIRHESTLINYRENERARLENIVPMQDLPRGGRAESITTTMEIPETFRGIRKALVGMFDEQDLIDFPWLAPEVARLLAVAARNFMSDMSWKPLLANDDLADGTEFFHADRGNTHVRALDETNLFATLASMNTQRSNGESTGHRAKYLVVAEALLGTARKLAHNIQLNDGGDLIVRSDPRIDNGMTDPITGEVITGDPTRWFLFAGNMPAVEVSLMTKNPVVNTWMLKEGTFGLGWAMNWSMGCVGIDPLAAQRCQAA